MKRTILDIESKDFQFAAQVEKLKNDGILKFIVLDSNHKVWNSGFANYLMDNFNWENKPGAMIVFLDQPINS